jgi:putative membrane protein
MISAYTDHAANERTFLAWIRTGIAVIALGFVIEKFNLFMLTLAGATVSDVHHSQLATVANRIGRFDGLFFVLCGVGLLILALVRFVRTTRLIDDAQAHSARSIRTELILSAWLVLLVTIYSAYLAFS